MSNTISIFSTLVTNTKKHININSLPVQGIRGASSTHAFITEQAVKILENDGYKRAAIIFSIFDEQLKNGVEWVDKGLKSVSHYYDPDTGTGMWLWPNAAERCAGFFHKSLYLWQKKKHDTAMFFLGAAAHLIQDVCVPHHAACEMFNDHLVFENWAVKRKNNFKVESGGIYEISLRPEEWIAENARLAKDYFHYVNNGSHLGYHKATKVLLPRAQYTTAGFFLNYYKHL